VIRPGFRRDRLPGSLGFLDAVLGPLLVVGLVTAVAALVYRDRTMTEIVLLFGINAIMVVGFQLFVGSTGLVSFGHIAFMAIGAYGAGIVSIPAADKDYLLPDLPGFFGRLELGVVPALLVGGSAAALFAFVTGSALMRLSGAAASIATLGLLVITVNVLSQATAITHGPRALFGVPEYADFGSVFGALAVVVLISALFKWSRAGLRARANRDDLIAAEAAGVGSLSARLPPFVLSAFITGIAGGLYGMLITAFSPASFTLSLAVVVLTMAIIGGVNSITGALIGASLVTVLNEALRRVEDGFDFAGIHVEAATGISSAVLGVALILTLRLRPAGLLSSYEFQPGVVEPPRDESLTTLPPEPEVALPASKER
jgi:branched-chain amino acid transport system permease protein